VDKEQMNLDLDEIQIKKSWKRANHGNQGRVQPQESRSSVEIWDLGFEKRDRPKHPMAI